MKVFQLFAAGSGFSNAQEQVRGLTYFIAAASSTEAYRHALRGGWAVGPGHPRGIVQVSLRSGGRDVAHWTWCGCRVAGGLGVRHGDGRRLLGEVMWAHWTQSHAPGSVVGTDSQAGEDDVA